MLDIKIIKGSNFIIMLGIKILVKINPTNPEKTKLVTEESILASALVPI